VGQNKKCSPFSSARTETCPILVMPVLKYNIQSICDCALYRNTAITRNGHVSVELLTFALKRPSPQDLVKKCHITKCIAHFTKHLLCQDVLHIAVFVWYGRDARHEIFMSNSRFWYQTDARTSKHAGKYPRSAQIHKTQTHTSKLLKTLMFRESGPIKWAAYSRQQKADNRHQIADDRRQKVGNR
jgi:hypothetical protein